MAGLKSGSSYNSVALVLTVMFVITSLTSGKNNRAFSNPDGYVVYIALCNNLWSLSAIEYYIEKYQEGVHYEALHSEKVHCKY